ncbi:unnamed protein product [Sphagnum troendelagicum]
MCTKHGIYPHAFGWFWGVGERGGRLKQRATRQQRETWFGPDTQERHHGVLFNETPPPPKQKMKWEDWELPYYATAIMAVLLLAVGLSAKRDTRIETWARKQALERPVAEEEE